MSCRQNDKGAGFECPMAIGTPAQDTLRKFAAVLA
jgi:hypothetical protein